MAYSMYIIFTKQWWTIIIIYYAPGPTGLGLMHWKTQRLLICKMLQGRCNNINFHKFVSQWIFQIKFWKIRDIITLHVLAVKKLTMKSETVWCTSWLCMESPSFYTALKWTMKILLTSIHNYFHHHKNKQMNKEMNADDCITFSIVESNNLGQNVMDNMVIDNVQINSYLNPGLCTGNWTWRAPTTNSFSSDYK